MLNAITDTNLSTKNNISNHKKMRNDRDRAEQCQIVYLFFE